MEGKNEKRKGKNPINFLKVKKGLTPLEGKNEKGKGKNPINFFKGKKVKREKRAEAVTVYKRKEKRKGKNSIACIIEKQ